MKDKSIIINQLMSKNVIADNFIKFKMPQTWSHVKEHPNERVLSFLCSIVNTHINIFIMQVFKRNLIETFIVPDSADGNSKNDRYRATKTKINEEYVTICSLDMVDLAKKLFKKYEDKISLDEIEYYRKNLKPSRIHQLLIEIYFFNHTLSAQEFGLLRSLDWFRLLLIMKYEIMEQLGVTKDTILESSLPLIITANITENPVNERLYLKDTKYLATNQMYNELVEKYYSTIIAMNEDILKKFLITFVNSTYKFVMYERKDLLGQEINLNKRELIDQLLNFLLLANKSMTFMQE